MEVVVRIHPAAQVLPEMPADEFAALVADIKRNGLLCSIAVLDDQIIDGRHRERACKEAGVEPYYDEVDLEDMTPGEYVWSLNGNRRHLSPSQRAVCYVELIGGDEKQKAKERQEQGGKVRAKLPEPTAGRARDAIAAKADVSPRTVEDAFTVQAKAPELFQQVKDGEISVSAAAKQVRESEQRQSTPWTKSEEKRKAAVESGKTVVAHKQQDGRLIQWAMQEGLWLPVDRTSAWGNPFILDEDGDRNTVCENYETYLQLKPSLLGKLSSLRGKVLGCWCHPDRCHADHLAELANRRKK